MRRFVRDGPELPYPVLQAHEEERLVFFCGAGISYYTGLPGFKCLVRKTFKACGHPLSESEETAISPEDTAFRDDQYDQALHLLEENVGREVARRKAIKILSKPLKRGSGHLRLHRALLDLAKIRDGGYRLITTNFDNRFARANPKVKLTADAPRIGWPRLGAWRHLTYLHGRVSSSDPNGEDLILSSGDFGRAYLTEGWASRFLVELFRDYVVLFVGYSLNDPVLRYMVDALATDMRDGRFKKPYVLAPYRDGDQERQVETWRAKGVEPIPFPTGPDGNDYSLQEKSLILWAEHYKGGLDSRIATAVVQAQKPYVKTPNDDEIRNIAWALSKKDGSIARAFANADPPPDISWLKPLSSLEMQSQRGEKNQNLFQLPSPPPQTENGTAHHLAPLSGRGAACLPGLPIDVVTYHLGRWLAHHRQAQELVDWVIEREGIIHPDWRDCLAVGLDEVGEPWRSFWSLIVDGAATPPCDGHRRDDYLFSTSIRKGEWPNGVEAAILRASRSWLHPGMRFPLRETTNEPQTLSDIVEFRLQIANDYLISTVLEHSSADGIRRGLALLADALTSRLADALELATRGNVIGAAQYTTGSFPSLYEQADRSALREWTPLVYLLVEAVKSLNEIEPTSAQSLSARWRYLATVRDLSVFKRLAVFALTEIDPPTLRTATEFLLSSDAAILWSDATWREVTQFLRTRSPLLDASDREQLVEALILGPDRKLFPYYSGSDAEFQELARELQLRRSTPLLEAGLPLPDDLRKAIEAQYPAGAPEDITKLRARAGVRRVAPPTADDLLGESPERICEVLVAESGWDAGHRLADIVSRDLDLGLAVMQSLVAKDASGDTWEIGLGQLSKLESSGDQPRALTVLLDMARRYPSWLTGPGVRPVSRFLFSQADKLESGHEAGFLELWDMAFATAQISGQSTVVNPSGPVDEAINAPGGDLAQALIDRLFSRHPTTRPGIPQDLAPRFDRMWIGETDAHRHARVILASRVLWLYRIDPEWTRRTILVAMGADDEQALGLWSAMLWQAHWDVEIVTDLQSALRSIFDRMHIGPEHFARQLSEWVASILVYAPDTFADELVTAFFRASNAETLHGVISVFKQTLQEAGERSPNLWADKIERIFDRFWPADRGKKSSGLSGALLRMALASREAFPSVINKLSDKALVLRGSADTFIFTLSDQGNDGETYNYVAHHPEAVLTALDMNVDETLLDRDKLGQLLNRIVATAPATATDRRMVRLKEIVAQG